MSTIEKYSIKLLTQKGIITVEYSTNQDLTQFEQDIHRQYGDFITLQSTLLDGATNQQTTKK